MKKMLLCMLLALLSLEASAAGLAPRDGAGFDPDQGLDLGRSFTAQRDGILRGMEPGGVYGEVRAADKRTVREALERIGDALDKAGGVDGLSEDAKVRVFNEQEMINVLLGDARADSRLVCRRERATGSNLRNNRCATEAQRRRAQEASLEMVRNLPTPQPKEL